MTQTRIRWLLTFLTVATAAVLLYAQNPVSIAQLGTGTTVTTTLPVSGTVTVTQGTASNLKVDLSGTGANATAIKVDGSAVTQPVSGTVTANQGGTWTVQPGNTANTTPWLVTGSGSAGTAAAGVLTVQGIASMTPVQVSQATAGNLNATVVGTGTFATQATLQTGTNQIGHLEANQSVNVAQLAGTTTDTNSGNKSAGTLRVVLATDQPQLTNKLLVTPDANSAVNVAQVGGSAVVAGPCERGTVSSVVYDSTTNGKVQLIGLQSGQVVYVCGVSLTQSTTSAVTVSFGSGTGTNCGSTYTAKTPAWPLQAPTSVAPAGLVLPPSSKHPWFQTATSEALCISTSAGVSVQALITYTQF